MNNNQGQWQNNGRSQFQGGYTPYPPTPPYPPQPRQNNPATDKFTFFSSLFTLIAGGVLLLMNFISALLLMIWMGDKTRDNDHFGYYLSNKGLQYTAAILVIIVSAALLTAGLISFLKRNKPGSSRSLFPLNLSILCSCTVVYIFSTIVFFCANKITYKGVTVSLDDVRLSLSGKSVLAGVFSIISLLISIALLVIVIVAYSKNKKTAYPYNNPYPMYPNNNNNYPNNNNYYPNNNNNYPNNNNNYPNNNNSYPYNR